MMRFERSRTAFARREIRGSESDGNRVDDGTSDGTDDPTMSCFVQHV